MKNTEVQNILFKEFAVKDIVELNKILKVKIPEKIKFKLMGPSLGYIGLTVVIKMVTPEGLKIFDVNRVRLVRFEDLTSFEKAGPKVPRPKYDKPKPVKVKPGKPIRYKKTEKAIDSDDGINDDESDDIEDDEDDFDDEIVIKRRPRRTSFIPTKKK